MIELINKLRPNLKSIELIAEFLEYEIGNNPIDSSDAWKILFSDKTNDKTKGVIALKTIESLQPESSTIELRRLYQFIEELKLEFSTSFDVIVVGFVGFKRLVLFPFRNGNRDTRLDLNSESVKIPLYRDNFNLLGNKNIILENDIFGFGDIEINLDIQTIFKKELNNHFRQTTNFYRKKLSELITVSNLKDELVTLLNDRSAHFLKSGRLVDLIAEKSFTNALGTVVDTIVLRQLMRRFLEGYYGPRTFETSGIALGIGDGTLDDAIKRNISVNIKDIEEKDLIKINKKKNALDTQNKQITIFDIFDEDEKLITPKIDPIDENSHEKIKEVIDNARKQFQLVFEGDLFAGSVGLVSNNIEKRLADEYPEFVAQMWIDTSSDKYSFRYEDLPPTAIEEHYENSMSQNILINFEDGTPIVYYGSTESEQKSKGAYYTDGRLVEYIIKQTVDKKLSMLINELKKAINNGLSIEEIIRKILDFKVADLTCGGGSFLRGAFLNISSKHSIISELDIPENILKRYPMFKQGKEGEVLWEKYVLHNMIYGVDFDYKAVLISSLTLSLTSIEHSETHNQLPNLIGKNIIHQNSLVNSVPFYKKKEIYSKYKEKIKILKAYKKNSFDKFIKLRDELQLEINKQNYSNVAGVTEFLHIGSLEISLPEIFFDDEGNLKENSGFDCIVGNPPWEINKPYLDEFYGNFDDKFPTGSSKKFKNTRINELNNMFPFIDEKWKQYKYLFEVTNSYFANKENFNYQQFIIEGIKTGGDKNLYIVSVERFDQLLKDSGALSIIIPDNFATDENSTGIRHLIFDNYSLIEFLSFENRKKIFAQVHASYKFAIMTYEKKQNESESFKTFFYEKDINNLFNDSSKFNYPYGMVYKNNDYKLIEVNNEEELSIMEYLSDNFSKFKDISSLEFKNDYHKTNDSNLFLDYSEETVPLYEGKFINQFVTSNSYTQGVNKSLAKKRLGVDYTSPRICIRTIGSSTNKRSLIVSLLPPKSVATNSLHVQKDIHKTSLNEQIYYTCLMNSYLLDFYLRKLITTNISKSFLYKLPIKRFNQSLYKNEIIEIGIKLLSQNPTLNEIFKETVKSNIIDDIAKLNAYIFIDYELEREKVVTMLRSFETPKHKNEVIVETQKIINYYDSIKNTEGTNNGHI